MIDDPRVEPELSTEAYFLQNFERQFGAYNVQDEELHYGDKTRKPHYALSETQYYGFFVPEVGLHCFTWIWAHPNLGSVTAGTMAWRGVKPRSLACELFDYRNHMSMDVFADSFMDFRLDNGLSVKMESPGRRFRLKYSDPARGNHFDVVQEGVGEPFVWPSNNHFEQVMHCKGGITLRGESYPVDCFSIRDRSFGEYRLENPVENLPPNHWITGVFDENFAFCIVGTDDPKHEMFWSERFAVDPSSKLRFGWIVYDDAREVVTDASIRTRYDMANLFIIEVALTITTASGRVFEFQGTSDTTAPFPAWSNMRLAISSVKWISSGRSGIGEIQSAQFTDFVRAFS